MIVLKDIYWERVNLHLVFDTSLEGLNIILANNTNKMLKLKSDTNEIVINVTNTPEGEMFDKGKWNLIISDTVDFNNHKEFIKYDNKRLETNKYDTFFKIDEELLSKLDEKSKIFNYRGRKCAYIVDFYLDPNLQFYVCSNFMIENSSWKKFLTYKESETLVKKLITFARKRYLNFIKAYYWLCRMFKFNKKKRVLFLTENSNELIGNLKALYDYLDTDKVKCTKKVCAYDIYDKKNLNILRRCKIFLKEIFLLAQSDVVFVDNYTPKLTHLELSKKCKLVQLWHAGIGFKSVGYARFGIDGSPHPARSCHRTYTDAVVDQESLVEVYKEVYGNKESNFKSFGIPRLDGYLDKETIENKVKEMEKINPLFTSKKVILFSPTYRGNGSSDAYYDYSLIDLERIYKYCKENNFIFVVKMHPFIKEQINIPEEYKDLILEYSSLDINDLIYVSDIMITDYSSCAYEFSLFNRLLIFYRFDKSLYEYLRPMHTVKCFTKNQAEVKKFDELMQVLEDNKNIDINERYSNLRKLSNTNSCENIINEYVVK